MIAQVIINTNAKELNKTFDYIIPEHLKNSINVGSRVIVPFGNQKQKYGYVIGIEEVSEFANKEILGVEDNVLGSFKVELASLMANRYFCNISDCIKLMLPPGTATETVKNKVKMKKLNFVYLSVDKEKIQEDIENKKLKSSKQIRVLEFLMDWEENNDNGIYTGDLEKLTDTAIATIKVLEKNGYIFLKEQEVERNPLQYKEVERDTKKKLTEEQQHAYNNIEKDLKNGVYSENLIYGVTGSRKDGNIFATNRKGY
jgi:primosomal protein N' (replication factor Y)